MGRRAVKLRIPGERVASKTCRNLCRKWDAGRRIRIWVSQGRSAAAGHMLAAQGVAALVLKLRRVKFDKGQPITCANCLKGSYVGYYAASYGLTVVEAESLEKVWRTAFRSLFGVHANTPVAHCTAASADR